MLYNITMINEKLKYLRKKSGKTQREMAKLLNISQNAYCKYELGTTEPNIQTIIELSKIFGVNLDFLMKEENNETFTHAEELKPNQIITIGRSGKKEIYELDEEDKELFDKLLEKYSKKNK